MQKKTESENEKREKSMHIPPKKCQTIPQNKCFLNNVDQYFLTWAKLYTFCLHLVKPS